MVAREPSLEPPRDLCILVATCDRYLPIARWTVSCIHREWDEHPPIFVSGASGGIDGALPLVDDPRDWMAVTAAAVKELKARGFRWIYLILDDLPPIGRCDATHLNRTIPAMAAKWGATCIGLLGWGQRRAIEGEDLGSDALHLGRNTRDYRWKFSLHPSLWSSVHLLELLEIRMMQFPPGGRTPWNFERHRDLPDGPVPERLLQSTYRVCGWHMTKKPFADTMREITLFGLDLFRFYLRVVVGERARLNFDKTELWLYHFYRGPYPIFWSGTMRQGKPAEKFSTFLRYTRRISLLKEWQKVIGELVER